jgi:hypothetical protein
MSPRAKYLLALAAALPLLGQGCATNMNTQVDSKTPDAQIDASIDAELDAAAEIDREERMGDSDADVVENDRAELNSYSEMQYDLP